MAVLTWLLVAATAAVCEAVNTYIYASSLLQQARIGKHTVSITFQLAGYKLSLVLCFAASLQVQELLHNPESLVQLVLSGGYIMYAGGAVATAAAVFAAGKIGANSINAQAATGGGGAAAGGSSGSVGAGGGAAGAGGAPAGGAGPSPVGAGPSPVGRGMPVVAAAAMQGSSVAARPEEDSRDRHASGSSSSSYGSSSSRANSSKWRSLLLSSIDEVAPYGLPSVSELPSQLSQMLASDQGGMMSHLHDKAAQAAATTQVRRLLGWSCIFMPYAAAGAALVA